VRKADNHFHVPSVLKSESLNLLETPGPVQDCNGIALFFALSLFVILVFLISISKICIAEESKGANVPPNIFFIINLETSGNNMTITVP